MDVSQSRMEPENGTEITDKVDEGLSTSIFGQDCCRIDISEKDIPGTGGGATGWSSDIKVMAEECMEHHWTLDGTGHQQFSGPGR